MGILNRPQFGGACHIKLAQMYNPYFPQNQYDILMFGSCEGYQKQVYAETTIATLITTKHTEMNWQLKGKIAALTKHQKVKQK